MLKIKKENKIILILSIFIFIVVVFFISRYFYIDSRCKNPDTALEYLVKHNDDFKIKKITSNELIFSSDDLLIYKIDTISKKSFEYDETYTVTLKKESKNWILYEIKILNQ